MKILLLFLLLLTLIPTVIGLISSLSITFNKNLRKTAEGITGITWSTGTVILNNLEHVIKVIAVFWAYIYILNN